MKNKIFNLGVLAVLLTFVFMLTGCEDLTNPLTGKTPLDTPANVRVDDAGKTDFTLKWDAVTGADSYTLDIDGELKSVSGSTTSYDLRALTVDPKVYPIRVRAVAYNGDEEHSDSAYSAPLNVEPAEYIFEYDDESAVSPSVQLGRSIARAAGGGGTITGLTNYGKGLERIVIPPRIGSITVTAIGDDAFKDNPIMTAISLPETLVTIGAGALSGTNIASLVIPESVLNIGDGAFSNIIVLIVVVFVSPEPPALGDGVFTGSEAIETIVVPDGSGSAYTEMIEEKAPDLAEQAAVEEAKEEKLLVGIEVIQPPKTAYTEGEQFSSAGMTVIARYSDNTASSITNYTVMLQTSNGGFSAQSRALTVNDTAVRLSYTEGTITRTTTITITVTGQTPTSYAITVNQTTGGTITTNPSGSATAGTTVTITGEPDDNYYLAGIRVMAGNTPVDSQDSPDGDGYTFTMPAAAVTVTGTFEEKESGGGIPFPLYGINVYSGVGGTISIDPSEAVFQAGTTVTVTVSLEQGYTLESLSVTNRISGQAISYQTSQTSTGVVYTFTMPAAEVWVGGLFSRNGQTGYTLMVYDGYDGTVTANPSGTVQAGATITVTVTPDQGYEMENLYITNQSNGQDINYQTTDMGYTFTMPASDVSVSAGFAPIGGKPSGYAIIVNQTTGGTISTNPSGNAPVGTTVTVTVSPNQGYTFNSSSLSVVADNYPVDYQTTQTSTGISYTFTMPDSDVLITGTFTGGSGQTGYAITVGAVDGGTLIGGTITTNPSGSATAGTTVTITVTPDRGCELESLSVTDANGSSIEFGKPADDSSGNVFTFTMPASDVTITGTFSTSGSGGGDPGDSSGGEGPGGPPGGGGPVVGPGTGTGQ